MQGKRKNQINDSEYAIMWGIFGILITMLGYLLIYLIEKSN